MPGAESVDRYLEDTKREIEREYVALKGRQSPPFEPHLWDQLEALDTETKLLHESFDRLAQRLVPLTVSRDDERGGDVAAMSPGLSQVAGRISVGVVSLRSLRETIDAVHSRLDV